MTAEEFEIQLDAAITEREAASIEHKKAGDRLSRSGKEIQHILGRLGEIEGCLIIGKYAVVEMKGDIFNHFAARRQVMLAKNFELEINPGSKEAVEKSAKRIRFILAMDGFETGLSDCEVVVSAVDLLSSKDGMRAQQFDELKITRITPAEVQKSKE